MTSSTSLKSQFDASPKERQNLPTMYDLPSEDPKEPGLPDEFHLLQAFLLLSTFFPTTFPPELVFSACDLNIYYDLDHPQWHKRPDWFGVVGTPTLYEGHDLRYSYVTWIEPANPTIVVELLSTSTKKNDLGQVEEEPREIEEGPDKPPSKWEVYERILKIPYYVAYGRRKNEIRIFHLVNERYQEVQLSKGRFFMPELGISLGFWRGSFRGRNQLWLRWFTSDGELILAPEEEAALAKQEVASVKQEAALAKQEAAEASQKVDEANQRAILAEQKAALASQETDEVKQQVDEAFQQAAEAKKRTDKLIEKLRQLGIDLDEIE